MEIKEGKLYFIKDEFLIKYGDKYNLMENKEEKGTKRPTYFCFRDSKQNEILWFVPMSKQYEKYMKIYEIKKEILQKARTAIALANKGMVSTYTKLPEFIKDLRLEIENTSINLNGGN